MAAAQANLSSVMHGEHWRPRPVLTGDLENFRNNGLSAGFDNVLSVRPGATENTVDPELLRIIYAVIRETIGDEFFKTYYSSGVGNPKGPDADGYLLTLSDLHAVRNAWQLSRFIPKAERIVEIGPGYGALAAILRHIYPDAEIILVDLPEHRNVTEYYLDQVGAEDIQITAEPPDGADVAIALRCLGEMPAAQVCKYIEWAQMYDVDWFYIINRYFKQTITKHYPFDKRWALLVSLNDYITGQLHEFLLRRTSYESDILRANLDCLPPYGEGTDMLIWLKGIIQVQKAHVD